MKQRIKKNTFIFSALAAFGLVFATGALARGGKNKGGGDNFEAHQAKMEQRIKEKLAPKLGLDERTAERLADIMKEQGKARRAAMKVIKKERQALKSLVEANASDQDIQRQLDKLQAAVEAKPKKTALFEETARILTPTQQAKLVLNAGKMKRRMGKKMRRHRQMKKGGDFEGGFGGEE